MYAISTEYKAPYLQIGIVIRARGGSGRGSLEEGCNFFTVFGFYSAFLDENRGRFKQRSCGNRRKFENSSYHERLIIQRRKRNPGERIRGRDGGKNIGIEKAGGHRSHEAGAAETTSSAKEPGEESCGGGLLQSTNLGDGEIT